MAVSKSINFLPEIFRSETNQKFLAATVDQLISEPDFRKVSGYIGRKFAPTYRAGDSYIIEPSTDRQNYQLEPSIVVQDNEKNIDFYSNYVDLIQKVKYYGGITDDHSRLFSNESYNFNGLIDFDKFVNFNQYYWLPDGPPAVTVSADTDINVLDFTVRRDATSQSYKLTGFGNDTNPTITLVKGTTYTFRVAQNGRPFWIQTAPGPDGTRSVEAETLARQVLGVENNGIDSGLVTFRVPASNAQDTYISATKVADVDFATTLSYAQLQSHLDSEIAKAGGIDGVIDSLQNRTVIFIQRRDLNEDWQDPGVFDFDRFDAGGTFPESPYEYGETVPFADRYDIFRINAVDVGDGHVVVKLVHVQEVNVNEKVYVKAGNNNSGVEYYKTAEGYWEVVQPITATLNDLYYQDATDAFFGGRIKLIEPDLAQINIDLDVLGQKNYTSPNGVKFTNGMKVTFDNTVIPSVYQNNSYIVEGVGKSIRLVGAGNLIVPENYAAADKLSVPDYVTINRGSQDLNAWSRSNRWFHSELISLAAGYRNDPSLLVDDTIVRASRPIIEFEPDLYLFNYGQVAKAPVDILDYSVTDAFKEVEGQLQYVIQLPNGVTRPLTNGTRIIFAGDNNPDVRNRIYRVDFITTSERTQIHLVSQNTESLPTYSVTGAQIVDDVQLTFVGGNPLVPASGTATVDPITGTITAVTVSNVGVGYRSTPTITFAGGTGTGANVAVTILGGSVESTSIESGGSGYSVAPTYTFVPTVEFTDPVPSIGARKATGEAVMEPTTVKSVDVEFSGVNYIADPYVEIQTDYDTTADVRPVYSGFKYVDYVRLTEKGSGYFAGTKTVTFTNPNLHEAEQYYVDGPTDEGGRPIGFGGTHMILDVFPTGIAEGWIVYSEGIVGGTTVESFDSVAKTVELSNSGILRSARSVIFKSNEANVSVVTETVRFANRVKVSDTSVCAKNMYVTSGGTPLQIVAIATGIPVTLTTLNSHNLSNGDQITITGVVGTTELNNNTYYVNVVGPNTLQLFSNPGLTEAVDGRGYTTHTLNTGAVTAFTVQWGVYITKIISATELELSQTVSVLAGATMAFIARRAVGVASADSKEIYTIKITEPGAGYLSAPTVEIEGSDVVSATGVAIMANPTIDYFDVVSSGAGYAIGNNIVTTVIDSQLLETTTATAWGTRQLSFASADAVKYIKAGWIALLVVEDKYNDTVYYGDFSRVPYVEPTVTGPNPDTYQAYMDIGLTRATVLKVASISGNSITLNGDIDSVDADGEQIDLPVGSRIYFSAQDKFFTEEAYADSRPIGNQKSTFIIQQTVFQASVVKLNTVAGIQVGMAVNDLANTLPDGLIVLSVDQYNNTVQLNKEFNTVAGIPLNFSSSALVTTTLNPSKIKTVSITDPGAEYTSAPSITIEPVVPAVTKTATSDGTDTIEVNDLTGIVIGSVVTSEYDVDGNGITTGAIAPKVVEISTLQIGTNRFRYLVRLNQVQPVFSGLLVSFTYTARAISLIQSQNTSDVVTNDETPDTYEADNTVLVVSPTVGQSALRQRVTGVVASNQYWFDGTSWIPAQQKRQYNQSPGFDVFDENGYSAGDTTVYPGSKFEGTAVFAYKTGTGAKDTVLGIPLSYRSFQNVGDIEFENRFDVDTFRYTSDRKLEVSKAVNSMFLRQKSGDSFVYRNIWTRAEEDSKQYQIITHDFDGKTNYFQIDTLPRDSQTIPYIKVYVDNKFMAEETYQVVKYGARYAVVVEPTMLSYSPPSKVDILVYGNVKSKLGYFQVPSNLDTNSLNTNFTTLTLGQMRNHLTTMSQNHYGLTGSVLGTNNIRDTDIKGWTGSILQHSSPVVYSALFLGDQGLNFVESVEHAQKEYTKFKNKFLDLAVKTEIDIRNIPNAVDTLMNLVTVGKNTANSWYDSDMVPYGSASIVTTIRINDDRQRRYEIPSAFNDTVISRRSVLVYQVDATTGLNKQLIKGIDFTFNKTLPAIDLAQHVQLAYTQQLVIVDRPSTVGNYIPETPTKLGLYPKFVPTIFVDNTYQTPTRVLQGHDGSLTPVFNDYRDELLLELELRIYNNIKVDYQNSVLDVYDHLPGKYRATDYSRTEFNRLLTKTFLKWIGSNQIDYASNTSFQSNNAWTWNYRNLKDSTGEALPGFWRAIYQYYYDTDRPNTAPWEMLGFSEQPSWWTEVYGPAPYTGGNKFLWDDLEAGRVRGGAREGVDQRFARPGLSKVIPVDDTGLLKSPEKILVAAFDSSRISSSWAIGDQGPVETAWRRSSDFPYAVQIALALAKPAFYFGSLFDTNKYYRNTQLDQLLLTDTHQRVTPASFTIPDDGINSGTVTLTAGYTNWIRDYYANRGIDGTARMVEYLRKFDVKLSYKLAGYTDSKFMTVLADQSSPNSNNSNIIIPPENFKVFLNKSAPLTRVIYSGVILEKTASGYSVSGYDLANPYFTIIPSVSNSNSYYIDALDERAVIFRDYQRTKLTVPYGYEFTTKQEVVDFLVSYGRFLTGQGLVFDSYNNDLETKQDWALSAKEFLTWSQQGWATGNILVLSPVFSSIKVVNKNGIVDHVENILSGSKILDQNFTIIKNSQFTVTREDNTFTLKSMFGQTIGLADLNIVQYEHVMLFDNITVFSDVIYQPELGNRQYRLKLVGNKTGNWTGQLSPAGFIYNKSEVDTWTAGARYLKGSLVNYKGNYYYATQTAEAAAEFDFNYWAPVDKDKIKTGLLPNFATNAEKFNRIYEVDAHSADSTIDTLSQGIIGYRDRSYFQDFDLDPTTKAKFYQGFIKQKGTMSAITSLTKGQFNNLTSEIGVYEEWALRVGEYGALGSDQFVEFVIDEDSFVNDPTAVVLLNRDEKTVDGLVNLDPVTIYRTSEEIYNKNPIQVRADTKPRVSDNITAGYPRVDDVDGTIFDITQYQNFANLVSEIGAGYKLWVAKDFNKTWNVYRATETNVLVTSLRAGLDTNMTVATDIPHKLSAGDLFVLKNFDTEFDGFYRVTEVVDNLTVLTTAYRNTARLRRQQAVEGSGVLFKMESVRYKNVSNIIETTPLHGWRNKDRVWVDDDTGTGVWGVFEKNTGWSFDKLLPLREGDWRNNEGYGNSVKLGSDNNIMLAGTPNYSTGSISGVRVISGGSGYDVPDITPSAPDADGGVAPGFTVTRVSGTLVNPVLVNAGDNYTTLPNIAIVDEETHTTLTSVIDSSSLQLDSVDNIYQGDYLQADNGVDEPIEFSDGVQVSTINTDTLVITLSTTVTLQSNTDVTFRRGTSGRVQALLVPSFVTGFNLISGGIGFTATPTIQLVGGGGTGATAECTIVDGTIVSIVLTSAGSGYTEPPTVNVLSTSPFSGVDIRVQLAPRPLGDIIVTTIGQEYRNPQLVITRGLGDTTGAGATATVEVTNNSIGSVTVRGVEYGTGYTSAPILTVTDGSGEGSGAVVEAIYPTGSVKAFTRIERIGTKVEQVQTIRPFGPDAKEFGHAVDMGYTYAFISAPGTYSNKGIVTITQYQNSLWNYKQILFPSDLSEGDRYGESLSVSRDERWLYVGAPGANKVYVYAKNEIGTGQIQLDVVPNVFSYITGFVDTKSSAELKILGTSGREYEPDFDYIVRAGVITFIDFDRIKNEPKLYVTRVPQTTLIVPFRDAAGVYETSYTLTQRPDRIEQVSVVGSDGRMFVPTLEYIVIGEQLVFLTEDFRTQASIQVVPLDPFYILIDTLEPNDLAIWNETGARYKSTSITNTYDTYEDLVFANPAQDVVSKILNPIGDGTYDSYELYANVASVDLAGTTTFEYIKIAEENRKVSRIGKFGSSIATTNEGYQVIVGAPEVTVTGSEGDERIAGKVYVFDRSYQIYTGTASGARVFVTTNPLTVVTKVTVDDIEVTRGVDFTASGFNVTFTTPPRNGARIKVDVNQFNIIQSIENPDPIFQAEFGTTVSISPNNQSIFVGAPGYRSVLYYNGRVYRYVNQGLVYGEITSTKTSPQTNLSDSIRVNNTEVVLSESAGVTSRILNDIRNQNIIGVGASIEGISALLFESRGAGYFEANVGVDISAPQLASGVQAVIGDVTVFAGNGAINSYTVITPGSGYTELPTVQFTGANTTPAVATVSTSGSRLTLRVNNPTTLRQLDILPGNGTALDDIGFEVYALTQVIEHPDRGVPEKFGTQVKVDTTDGETLMVSSEGGATLKEVSFDDTTTVFDKDTTRFIDVLRDSGAVYIYDYLPIPGETLNQPGKYLYNQVLQNAEIKFNDNFGAAIDINKGLILVGADGADYYGVDTGLVHMFQNLTETKGWIRLRSRSDQVDTDYINRALAYDKDSQTVITEFDYYDPVKGKILGIADQDIDYKTSYDPAFYNKGANATVTVDPSSAWNEVQLGRVWWNLDACRFIDYEQGDLNYRIAHWGELFADSEIEILEWVESNVLPSEYATSNGDGEAKYADNSAYVETAYFDKQSGLIKTKYYFWVKNKANIDYTSTKRKNSIIALANIINAPARQDIPFVAVIAPNAFALYNANYLAKAQDTVFRLEYAQVINDTIAHSEYELVQQNNPNSTVPQKLLDKLIDSLSGENINGDIVPDLRLRDVDRFGISLRPRQTMISDQAKASKILVDFINNFFEQYLVTRIYNITNLKAAEPIPAAGTGYYNQAVTTIEERDYILSTDRFDGFKVLVEQDATNDGFWTIYRYENNNWVLERIQSHDATRYWEFVNWYTDGYSDQTQITYIINRYTDFGQIAFKMQAGDVVRVLDDGSGNFELYAISDALTPVLVGVGNGTIQLNNKLYDYNEALVGFDNTGFDSIGYSKTAAIEVRNILTAVINDVFGTENAIEINKLFFTMLNYILTEQKNVDWALKTSFVSVLHKIRKLEQFPNYIKDQQDYYEDYINEVKPYRTQVREYLLDYEGDDQADIGMSDFDYPSYYDPATGRLRTLDIDNNVDLAIVRSGTWNEWLQNYKYRIQSITVGSSGSGYVTPPTVSIVGGGGSGAKAVARILQGQVVAIELTEPGSGYTSQPVITFTGGSGTGATAYAELQQLANGVTVDTLNRTVRSVRTTISFDRTAYSSSVLRWQPYTTYHPGDIVIVEDVKTFVFDNLQDQALPRFTTAYRVIKTLLGSPNINLNQFNDETVVQKLTGSDIDNAIDRVAIYYKPGTPDSAILFGSPDTERLDPATTNNEATSTGNKWNFVAHSSVVPATHEYQYLAVGDRGLLGISQDGVNWENISLNDSQLRMRSAAFCNETTWVAVGDSGYVLLSNDARSWERTQLNSYRYGPAADALGGFVLQNAAQAIDLTSVAYASATNGKYIITVGNGSTVLANPTNTVVGLSDGWYSVKPQSNIYSLPVQFLTVHSESYGSLGTLTGDKYLVNIQISGNFVQENTYKGTWNPNANTPNINVLASIAEAGWVYEVSETGSFDFGSGTRTELVKGEFIVYDGAIWAKALDSVGKQLKLGYVIAAGVNGGVFITSYARLDDAVQGYFRDYNYDSGKPTDPEYPWIPLSVPNSIAGSGDGLSGEQINAIAMSDIDTHWIVAVGSAGSLIWNTVDSPLEVQAGSSDIGADTIGETVISHGIEVFKNFREFNAADFVAPLTKTALQNINLSDINWDGEKFVVVGDRSTVIWGFPGNQSEAYIDIGNLNPNYTAGSRRPTASWTGGEELTELEVVILLEDFAGTVVEGMTLASRALPTSGTVTGSLFNSITGELTIDIVFATPQDVDTVDGTEGFTLSYQITEDIPSGTVMTFTGPGGVVKELELSRDAEAGDTRIYVENYADVNANWVITGTGMPVGAMVRAVGKFAKFTWQYARGSGRDINVNYYSSDVNKTTVQLNKPFTADIDAGAVVTFYDPTGLKIQRTVTQNLNSGTRTLVFDTNDGLEIGYIVEVNPTLGIDVDTVIASTKTYTVGGVLDHLHRDIPDNVPGTSYSGVRVTGQGYTETATDLLSLDTTITSTYTDSLLGQRPEDIIVDGGKFIDTFSSHAPEELVPGQVIDSLQMSVFTANVVDGTPDYGNVVAYKIFTDYRLPTVYYRLPENATTELAEDLGYDDEEIVVTDISKVLDPNPALNQPGSIWVNAEKINYFGIDRTRGVLTDLRRGANRTSIPVTHVAGSIITDASPQQEVDRDVVVSLTTDIEVNNGFSGSANTVTYQSALTSTIEQGRIWLT